MLVSYSFITFLFGLFLLYYLIPKKLQWILLLAANFMFYFSAGRFYPIFILITSFTVYVAGRLMGRIDDLLENYERKIKSGEIEKPTREEKKQIKAGFANRKKCYMLVCLFVNLGILAVTKYTNFIIGNLGGLFEAAGKAAPKEIDLIVPLGISFYTFQAVGYLLDVYWNKCEVQKNFFRFTLFVSFFPQLIQGPISRYGDLSKTLYAEHKVDFRKIRFGLERILWGYFKKLVVADRLSTAVVTLMQDPDYYTGGFVFVGMIFYAIQLYADFTGGIDITIGIAETLGIHVEENFIRPYFSKNIIEYWRRWHISMGTWFRDYVFYPCSISKSMKSITKWTKKHFGMGGAKRVAIYIATFLTWLATGIWHGAEWHFIIWGVMNGIIIMITGELEPLYQKFHQRFPKLQGNVFYRAFQVLRTFLLMCCLRMFDTYAAVRLTFRQFFHMFTEFRWSQFSAQEFIDLGLTKSDYMIVFVSTVLMVIVSLLGRDRSVREKISEKPYAVRFGIYVLLFFLVLLFGKYGIGFDAKQFIYNQF